MFDVDLLIKALVRAFVLPPGGLIVLLALGVVACRARPRLARALVATATSLLWLGATPIVASAYERLVADAPALDSTNARSAQAIVVPAGGLRPAAAEFEGATLGRLTLERVRYGARVARITELPVLVTGGAGRPPRTEGELMKSALESEFSVPVRWVENRSTNTRENAAESARLLRPRDADGVRRIILVSHGFDMRRARREFEAVGFEVVPAPTNVATLRVSGLGDLLPHVGALERTYYVSYELLALGAAALGLN
jgi:uncharacterized SAM-binding protein YcdF (DUF218 family)